MSLIENLDIKSILSFNQTNPQIDDSNLFINYPDIDQYDVTDFKWVNDIHINTKYLQDISHQYETISTTNIENKKEILLKIIQHIDLTSLSGDDTDLNIKALTLQAITPLNKGVKEKLGGDQKLLECIHTAAVCVYPARVDAVINVLEHENKRDVVKVASVAAGFPSGQYLLETRLHEIQLLAKRKVNEIDIVIQRSLVLTNQWSELYREIKIMKETCGNTIHMKTILAVGELKSYENIYCASIVSMLAGSDFIKTSTGKEKTNATIPSGIIMCSAIKHIYKRTGKKIGLKPAGGISTWEDALRWINLVHSLLGKEWLSPDLFRIGASSLLSNILLELSA